MAYGKVNPGDSLDAKKAYIAHYAQLLTEIEECAHALYRTGNPKLAPVTKMTEYKEFDRDIPKAFLSINLRLNEWRAHLNLFEQKMQVGPDDRIRSQEADQMIRLIGGFVSNENLKIAIPSMEPI